MNYELSEREEQVLKLLLSGYLQKQVAHELGISESRVQDVKRIIKKKWQVHSDIEFILFAIKQGYIEIENIESPASLRYYAHTSNTIKVNYCYAPNTRKSVRVFFD
ncbi:MAG: response regulator transcription factor [Fluviicola sp.]